MINEKLIPQGKIDTRSIRDVRAEDLHGFTQCHFFAGIGGWPLALQLAGWPVSRPVWSGSCPCQPFSCAGKGLGEADERHLWPTFFGLIDAERPITVIGEQVASKAALEWLDGVFADLEGSGYACTSNDLSAAGIGAPHIRQRLYWCGLEHSASNGRIERWTEPGGRSAASGCEQGRLADSELRGPEQRDPGQRPILEPDANGADGGMGDADNPGLSEQRRPESIRAEQPAIELRGNTSFWSDAIWHQCRDGKARRISPQPALFPLAYGIPGRVGLLRGAGNAIVPEVAATFIQAVMESI